MNFEQKIESLIKYKKTKMEATNSTEIMSLTESDSSEEERLLDNESTDETDEKSEQEEEVDCKKLSCAECGEKFMFPYSLQKHIKKFHMGGKPHECKECGKRFKVINSLKRHTLTHTGEKPHVCPLCQQAFSQDINLTKHLRRHFNDKPYECDTCHKRFTDSGILKIHSRIHSGEKPYSCNICGKKFTQQGTLEKHIKIHINCEKTFTCKYCGKDFNSNSNLHSHLRIHNTEKKFECTMCCKKYSSLAGHYKHMKIHESEGNYGPLQRRKGVSSGEKIFECSFCEKKFQSFSGRYKHMKIHELRSNTEGSSLNHINHFMDYLNEVYIQEKALEPKKLKVDNSGLNKDCPSLDTESLIKKEPNEADVQEEEISSSVFKIERNLFKSGALSANNSFMNVSDDMFVSESVNSTIVQETPVNIKEENDSHIYSTVE